MAQHRTLNTGDPLPAGWLNALQSFLSTQVSENFDVTLASTTSLQVVASAGQGLVAVGFGGPWRFNTATVTAAAPANSAGSYPIYVMSRVNNNANEDSQTFDYSFGLKLATAPSGTGSEAISFQCGTYEWDGAKIIAVRGPRSVPTYETHIYTLSGAVNSPTGGVTAAPSDNTYLLPFWPRVRSNETVRLVGIYAVTTAGSLTINLYRTPFGGSESAIVSGLTVNTTATLTGQSIGVSDRDRLRLAVASLSAAYNATIQLEFERTILPV